ncbi:hypothetical protein ACHAW5_004651 [Stephanodiscus triporus]|uniref:Uncharacterized protein n=1 Tax=Stephanodiscus triporus TaxID=2934178 RepID=A0ABD3MJW7_9STRA
MTSWMLHVGLEIVLSAEAAAATAVVVAATSKSSIASAPDGVFDAALAILCAFAVALRLCDGVGGGVGEDDVEKIDEGGGEDPRVKSLQRRYLAVFLLLRMANWLQRYIGMDGWRRENENESALS